MGEVSGSSMKPAFDSNFGLQVVIPMEKVPFKDLQWQTIYIFYIFNQQYYDNQFYIGLKLF